MKILFEKMGSPSAFGADVDVEDPQQHERVWDAVPRLDEHVTLYMGEDQPSLTGTVRAVMWMQAPSGGVYVLVRLR